MCLHLWFVLSGLYTSDQSILKWCYINCACNYTAAVAELCNWRNMKNRCCVEDLIYCQSHFNNNLIWLHNWKFIFDHLGRQLIFLKMALLCQKDFVKSGQVPSKTKHLFLIKFCISFVVHFLFLRLSIIDNNINTFIMYISDIFVINYYYLLLPSVVD